MAVFFIPLLKNAVAAYQQRYKQRVCKHFILCKKR
jgi:hypothetical protein